MIMKTKFPTRTQGPHRNFRKTGLPPTRTPGKAPHLPTCVCVCLCVGGWRSGHGFTLQSGLPEVTITGQYRGSGTNKGLFQERGSSGRHVQPGSANSPSGGGHPGATITYAQHQSSSGRGPPTLLLSPDARAWTLPPTKGMRVLPRGRQVLPSTIATGRGCGLTCANIPLTWLSQSRWVQRLESVGSTVPPCAWMICARPGTVSVACRTGRMVIQRTTFIAYCPEA